MEESPASSPDLDDARDLPEESEIERLVTKYLSLGHHSNALDENDDGNYDDDSLYRDLMDPLPQLVQTELDESLASQYQAVSDDRAFQVSDQDMSMYCGIVV